MLTSSLVWALWHGLDVPHVWDIWGGFISLTSIPNISTALMRPRRPEKYCLQLAHFLLTYSNALYKQGIYGWDRTSAYIGAAGSRYQSTQHMKEWNEAWPQHRGLHALLFTNSVWTVLLRPTGLWTLKGCETGPTVYSPFPRRLESLIHLRM